MQAYLPTALYYLEKEFKMKARVFQSCVRSAILYANETWYSKEQEMDILRRTEKAINGESNVWNQTSREKYRRYEGYVGFELNHRSVVLKLGSTEPLGFGEAIAGVRPRSE